MVGNRSRPQVRPAGSSGAPAPARKPGPLPRATKSESGSGPNGTALVLQPEQAAGEGAGLEGAHVVEGFADADGMNRQAEALG